MQACRAVCRSADADSALVFTFLVSNGEKAMLSEVVSSLKLPESRAFRALEMLCAFGVCDCEGNLPIETFEPGEPAELVRARETDPGFENLCRYFEKQTGKPITRYALDSICSFYQKLALPADVVMLMMNYLSSHQKLSVRPLERLAYELSDREILTYDAAERYFTELDEKSSRVYGIMRILKLSDRRPSDKEREYIEKWIALGFSDEMVKLSYETAVLRTGKVSFPYIDGILERWNASGLKTPEAVKTRDGKGAEKAPSKEAAVRKMFEEKRATREQTLKDRLNSLCASHPDFAENERLLRLCASKFARSSGNARLSAQKEREELTQKRKNLLISYGLPEDHLDIKPDCPKCNDYGFVGASMCECFKKAMENLK